MEDKLTNWIYGIAGSSYVVMASLVIIFMYFTTDNALQDPLLVKASVLLGVYFFSLSLLHFSKASGSGYRLTFWCTSLAIHITIMAYVFYIFESSAAFVIMVPEIGILILMLTGIFSIWSKVRGVNI